MVKKAVIEVVLVEESGKMPNREIEDEIVFELSRNLHAIPWAASIQKTRVKNVRSDAIYGT